MHRRSLSLARRSSVLAPSSDTPSDPGTPEIVLRTEAVLVAKHDR